LEVGRIYTVNLKGLDENQLGPTANFSKIFAGGSAPADFEINSIKLGLGQAARRTRAVSFTFCTAVTGVPLGWWVGAYVLEPETGMQNIE